MPFETCKIDMHSNISRVQPFIFPHSMGDITFVAQEVSQRESDMMS